MINVSVPLYMTDENGGRMKPPEYSIVAEEPPPYEEAIKLNPGTLLVTSTNSNHNYNNNLLLNATSSTSSGSNASANGNFVVCLMDQDSSESEPLVLKECQSPPPPYHIHHFAITANENEPRGVIIPGTHSLVTNVGESIATDHFNNNSGVVAVDNNNSVSLAHIFPRVSNSINTTAENNSTHTNTREECCTDTSVATRSTK